MKNHVHFLVFAVLSVLVQMSLFLKQVDAAQKFLRGVKTLPTFTSLEEKQVLRLEKTLDKVHSVTTEQAAAILDLLDETLWSEDACAKLKTLVAEMTAEAEASQSKRDTQDYRMLPHYMTADLSEQLKAKQEKENVALQKLCKHAWLLGLRCPSELTLATLLCMAHYNSVSRMSDKDKYNFLLQKKPLLKKWLGALPDPTPYLLTLPQDPQELPAGMLAVAIPEGNPVEGPFPAAEVLLLARQIPLRVTNKAVSDPKKVVPEQGSVNSPARMFGQMMAGIMKGMGQARPEPSAKITILDSPKASAPEPRQLALEDIKPTSPVLPAGTGPGVEVPAGQRATAVVAETSGEKASGSMEKNLLNLRKSLADPEAEQTSVPLKRPAAKDKLVPAGMKRPAAALKRPAAAVDSHKPEGEPEGQKKQKQHQEGLPAAALKRPSAMRSGTSKTRASADERNSLLRGIPSAVRKQYADGCATCRWRPGCCVSCWKKRGYVL